MSRYTTMFDRLASRGEGAFGAFVMLGDPDPKASAAILDGLVAAGADMVEVGIPFSDPIADGPVIQAAAQRALAAGTRTADCFALLAAFRARNPDVPIGILTYANLVVARGRTAFYADAAAAGVDSVLVADVPALEAAPFVAEAINAGVDPVLIAAANTPPETLAKIARFGAGYTYCVARAGVTGARPDLALDHEAMLAALAAAKSPPPVFGFGISTPAQVGAALDAGAAGVICGSAIVAMIAEEGGVTARVSEFVAGMKAATLSSPPCTQGGAGGGYASGESLPADTNPPLAPPCTQGGEPVETPNVRR